MKHSMTWSTHLLLGFLSIYFDVSSSLDLHGCRVLRELCRDHYHCDKEVVYKSCARYVRDSDDTADAIPPMSLIEEWLLFPHNAANPYGRHQSRLHHHGQQRHKTVSQDVGDAVGPISQPHQWPFFPDRAYGPTEEKHRKGPGGLQPAQEQSRLYQNELEQGYEDSRFESEALLDKRSVNEAYEDQDHENQDELREDIEQRLWQVLRNYKKSISKDEIKEHNDGAVFHSQEASHAGSHHHSNGADDGDYSRLERAADYLDNKFVLHARESRDRGERDKIYRLEEHHENERNLHHEEGNRLNDVRSRIRNSEEELDVPEKGGEDYPGRKLVENQEKADLHLSDSVSHQLEAIKETIQLDDSSKLRQSNNAQVQKANGEEDSNKDAEKSQSYENSKERVKSFEKDSESLQDHLAENPYEKQRNEAGGDSIVNDIANDGQAARVSKLTHEINEHSEAEKHFYPAKIKDDRDVQQSLSAEADPEKGMLILQTAEKVKPNALKTVGDNVQKVLWGVDPKKHRVFTKISVDAKDNKKIHLHMQVPHAQYSSAYNPKEVAKKINSDQDLRRNLSSATGLTILHAKSRNYWRSPYPLPKDKNWDEFAIITAIVGGCTLGLIVASVLICSLKRRSGKKPIELQKKEALTDYEELCRTQMAVHSAASPGTMKAIKADRQRHGLVDGQGKFTKKTWREEPLAYNMDISTGHVILAYMEEHLKNEDKLSQEWEALCNYKADQDETNAGEDSKNTNKNRYSNVLPYDHTRVKLRETANVFHSDYINANYITDSDPRNPAYIATQGPLDNTVADFWQMIWEQGVVVIVNLTRLSDMGLAQCHRYWPEEGSDVYNTYQPKDTGTNDPKFRYLFHRLVPTKVHLISEHIWCDDYIVRSFYLKHLATQETRTITQFHFLTWPDLSIPESPKPLLEFRRKVNKCYRGQACPIVIHCNNGVGRTGTYILIDMVLKKMIKGTKEIDIAATLEHLRDQRPDMVKTKAQFEFTLAAVAEEVTAILSSLSS